MIIRNIAVIIVATICAAGFSVCAGKESNKDSTADSSLNNIISEVSAEAVNFDQEIFTPVFTAGKIPDDIFESMQGKSYSEGALPRDELSYLTITYIDYSGKTQIGDMIVNLQIADITLECFKELYENKFPINKISLIDNYNADDNLSMAADNSSSFCHRVIAGTNHLSNHSKGLAIDINPLINPYIRIGDNGEQIYDEVFEPYIDRTQNTAGIIKKDDICYEIFTRHGFIWGGDWDNPLDYQHFEFELDSNLK